MNALEDKRDLMFHATKLWYISSGINLLKMNYYCYCSNHYELLLFYEQSQRNSCLSRKSREITSLALHFKKTTVDLLI